MKKLDIVEKILPELNTLKESKNEETIVEVFKGKEGLKLILNDMIKEGKDYLGAGVIHYFEDEEYLSRIYINQWIVKMNAKNVKEKMILEEGTYISPIKNSEFRYLPKEYLFTSSFLIYGNKVAIFVWGKSLVQILITNKDIARSYKTQFDALWNIAK